MRNSLILVGLAAVGFAACASAGHARAPARRTAATTAATTAPKGSGIVAGRVRNREAGPAPYALVTAIAAEPGTATPLLQHTRCDAAGQFTFNHLTAGKYAFMAMSVAPQPAFAGSTLAMPVEDSLLVSITLDQPSSLQ